MTTKCQVVGIYPVTQSDSSTSKTITGPSEENLVLSTAKSKYKTRQGVSLLQKTASEEIEVYIRVPRRRKWRRKENRSIEVSVTKDK